jgi:hypothetical protein
MNLEKATPELFAALAAAQAEIENASKNSANPHFRSKYADLAEVLNTVRPVLAKHKIAVFQSTSFDGALVSVDTCLGHASGGSISSTASCAPAKTDAQGIGAATTYLRRYGLAAMAGVAQEDDDGNQAAHAGTPVDVATWLAQIAAASAGALETIGSELARAQMPQGAKAQLRQAYLSRRKALEVA